MSQEPKRILVLATEACAGKILLEEIRYRAGEGPARVRIVAPALTSRLQYWASDEDRGYEEADERLARSLQEARALGLSIEGAVGDPDPLQALDDEIRTFEPDEVIAATHPLDSANWLERDLVAQARARYEVPITHLVIDVETGATSVAMPASEPKGHVRERHPWIDTAIVVGMTVLAVVGTLVSLLLYDADAPTPLLITWVLVMDLGVKLALIVVVWAVLLRRPRADRLDI
jgi:hypothetical protein